ncbi:Phosphoenolpyruvate carboxylase [Indibacter alkaliphilus LW1]|uniref:Phosphoenolpyruvate carboxylase n=1 Tax=Indibacter alkaliphilus (strain CCUG 57479 / KCTC 22604 / LW1) TaxID=1189612 RepID=S2DMP2_INDAL|nr:phosphoenolpyruvate carboxylase [Indibacter alkaliphilus]EOZ98470.1 Phosphoenolpyruvate carboxylase [Indibacter alkaliphilus LW1]
MSINNYQTEVAKRFTIYNSLFLDLPFSDIHRTGTLLPILSSKCQEGFQKEKTPKEIIQGFFEEMMQQNSEKERHDLLFKMVQYVERQVVLFDSIEDAAFEKIHDLKGKGSISALIARADNDRKREALIEKLKTFSVRLTLTAHPTQFYPGNVLGIITDLEAAIRDNDLGNINLLLQQLGKTGFINKEKPSPLDEAVSLIWFLVNVFYKSIPDILSKLLKNLNIPSHEWDNPGLLKVGFWPGGDRDGNPFVTHDITVKVAERLQKWILRCYYRDVRKLRRRLTFKNVEPIMQKVENGLFNSLFENQAHYTSKESLLEDLYEARKGLIDYHDGLFLDQLDEFILKVKIFGFHFANMDVRQDSRKHDGLWDELIEVKSGKKELEKYHALNEEGKINYLLGLECIPEAEDLSDEFHQEMMKSFDAVQSVQKTNGEEGLHRYIISNCQSRLHILEVYQLAKLRFGKDQNNLPLDIVPLFETIDDLAEAPGIMRKLYENKAYSQHLKQRKSKQTIMLGFSDGTKDGGYIRANWSILRAKEELTKVSREYEVDVVFFDGRGGPPARGGGNMNNFYASLGEQVENEEIQVTIQGQTISANYGKPVSCTYNLEQLLSAGLENELYPSSEKNLNEEQRELIERLAETSYQFYKDFKNHPKFVPYLEHVTPLKFFGQVNIGSRPLKRGKSSGLKFEDLRAIPFVGSWAQMKQNIPGFFGVGAALAKLKEEGDFDKAKKLYQDSLFFRSLLGNSMQSLAKSFYQATAYLKDNKEYGDFWNLMFDEYQRTIQLLLEVSGMDTLLQDNLTSKESIAIREKIVLPVITIQQYAIQTMLETGKEDRNLQMLILRTMFAIINAARNAA